jgi:hypothetical protein
MWLPTTFFLADISAEEDLALTARTISVAHLHHVQQHSTQFDAHCREARLTNANWHRQQRNIWYHLDMDYQLHVGM